jgi:hypothetical protein
MAAHRLDAGRNARELRRGPAARQLKPTPAQRTESFRKIMDVLTHAQRQKLREALAR